VDPETILVYRLADFAGISSSIERATAYFSTFAEIVGEHEPLKDDPRYMRLCSEPDVRRELDRPHRGQRTPPGE
jgi:hypothetical protein